MDIVKELNKDGGYESIKNGSMTHAVNAMVSRDGSSIQNEQSIETIISLGENESIVGIISCSDEIVIFTNLNRIIRYSEDTGEINPIKTNWHYQGGKVIGTYTYNVNKELIVAITELNANEDVPLKIINLNKPDYLGGGNDIKYTLSPNVPKANINNWDLIPGAVIYKGIYNIFIRYKEGDNYTAWFPIGSPILVWDKDNTTVVEDSSFGYRTTNSSGSDVPVIGNFKFTESVNISAEKASYNIELGLSINNEGLNYTYFQIGYIVSTQKNEIKAFSTHDIKLGTTRVTIDNVNNEELSVDDITSSFFNLYNVKTLCNYNNRLYVANYKEENVNSIVKDIDVSGIRVRVKGLIDYTRNTKKNLTRSIQENREFKTTIENGYGYLLSLRFTLKYENSEQEFVKKAYSSTIVTSNGTNVSFEFIDILQSAFLDANNEIQGQPEASYNLVKKLYLYNDNEGVVKLRLIANGGKVDSFTYGGHTYLVDDFIIDDFVKFSIKPNLAKDNPTYWFDKLDFQFKDIDTFVPSYGLSLEYIYSYDVWNDIITVPKINVQELYKTNTSGSVDGFRLNYTGYDDTSCYWFFSKFPVYSYLKAKYPNSTIKFRYEYESHTNGEEPTDKVIDVSTYNLQNYTRIIYNSITDTFKLVTRGANIGNFCSYCDPLAIVQDDVEITLENGEQIIYNVSQLREEFIISRPNKDKTFDDYINEFGVTTGWQEDREPNENDYNPNKLYTVTGFTSISTTIESESNTVGRKFTDCRVHEIGYRYIEEGNKTLYKKEFMIAIPFKQYFLDDDTIQANSTYTLYDCISTNCTKTHEGLFGNLYICFKKDETFSYFGTTVQNCYIMDIPNLLVGDEIHIGKVITTGSGAYMLGTTSGSGYQEFRISEGNGAHYVSTNTGYRANIIASDDEAIEDIEFSSPIHKYAINHAVYNFFIHYVYPNGNITSGIRINNNMSYNKTISLGKVRTDNIELTMDITEDTLISNIRTKFEAYESQYGRSNIDTTNAHEVITSNIYKTISNVRFCNIFLEYNEYGIALYKNNNGDKMFRGIKIKDDVIENGVSSLHFLFDNIPLIDGFVGYFISYEKTEPILIANGIAVRRDDDFNTAFDEQCSDIRFYYPEFSILKKNPSGNLFYTNYRLVGGNGDGGPIFTDYYYVGGDPGSIYERVYNEKRAISGISIILPDDKDSNNVGREGVANIKLNSPLTLTSLFNRSADRVFYNYGILLNITDNLYMSENKELIPLGYIMYKDKKNVYDVGSYGYEDYNYNYDYYMNSVPVYAFNRNGVYYDASDPIPKKANDNTNLYPNFPYVFYNSERTGNAPIQKRNVLTPSLYPLFAKTIKSAPDERYYTLHTDNNSFVQNVRMVHMLPSTINDTFEISDSYVDYAGKKYNNYNERIYSNFVTEYGQTIRRSDVISDESIENKWRIFRPDNYKIISENKGNIINLIGVGIYLIAHCEHSMFIFNRDNTLGTKDKDVQMYMPDSFDVEYQEVFTSEKGYGGLQDFEAYVCNEAGYIFLDRSKKRLYRFDEKNLNDLGDGVQSILDEYLTKDVSILMGMDKENNRLICSFTGERYAFTISYSFVTNSWISLHTYFSRGFYNTKTNLYITSQNKKNIIGKVGFVKASSYLNYDNFEIPIERNPFYVGDNNNSMIVDILFNLAYDTIKVLNYISYDMYKSDDINFAGNKLLLFSNTSISRLEDITIDTRNERSLIKPYYEHGKWNYNYFRSVLNEVVTNYPIDRLTGKLNVNIDKEYEPFKSNLINGKYLGVRFVITDGTAGIELKKVECYINKYRD